MPELSKMEGLFYDYSWGTNNSGLKYNWHTQSYQMNGADITHMEAMSMVHTTYFSTAEETYKRTDYLIPGSPGDMMGTGVYSIVRERYSSQLITNNGAAMNTGGGDWYDKANTVMGAFDVAWGAKEELINYAAKSSPAINDLQYIKAIKVASKTLFAAQAGLSLYQAGNAIYTDNANKWGVAGKASLDITIGAISAFGGPIGWGVGAAYFVGDAAGWWGNWGEAAPANSPLNINKR